MTPREYLMDVSCKCSTDNVDMVAFEEAAAIIGGRDVVEEFLTCGSSCSVTAGSLWLK
jgi:hypothetical protein